jgi:hypothetical protein
MKQIKPMGFWRGLEGNLRQWSIVGQICNDIRGENRRFYLGQSARQIWTDAEVSDRCRTLSLAGLNEPMLHDDVGFFHP